MIRVLLLLSVTLFCAVTDMKSAKIRNKILVPFAIMGIVYAIFSGELLWSLLGLIIPFVVLVIPWRYKLIGAGDIKEIMVIGSIIGIKSLVNSIFPIFLCILFTMLVQLVGDYKVIGERLKSIGTVVWRMLKFNSIELEINEELDLKQRHVFKFGIGIFLGCVLLIYINYIQRFLIIYGIGF